jgi:hypothetical protein
VHCGIGDCLGGNDLKKEALTLIIYVAVINNKICQKKVGVKKDEASK